MTTRRLSFPGSAGPDLSAILELPADGRADAYAVFAHCFTCSKDLKAVVAIAQTLIRRRIAVLRFDFTGLGESAGEFADTTFSGNVEDLVAAAEHLEGIARAPSILIGHSLGGAAVLQAAHRLPSVRAVATIGAPADPSHVLGLVESSREEIERDGEAVVRIAGRPFRIRREFLEDLEADNMRAALSVLRRALLILHSPIDEIVGIDNAARLYEAARHPKSSCRSTTRTTCSPTRPTRATRERSSPPGPAATCTPHRTRRPRPRPRARGSTPARPPAASAPSW